MRGVIRVRKAQPFISPGTFVSGVLLVLTWESLTWWWLIILLVLVPLINLITLGWTHKEETHIDPS